MKRFISLSIIACIMLTLASCGSTQEPTDSIQERVNVPYALSAIEYSLFNNLYYKNDTTLVNSEVTKEGVFVKIDDYWSDTVRYFVWGYLDQTKCCDWEWEIDLSNYSGTIPENGSRIKVTGKFVASEASLDGYWIESPADLTVIAIWKNLDKSVDYDLRAMNGTLAYVQMASLLSNPDKTAGKTMQIYGRVFSLYSNIELAAIQHPYYDNYWILDLDTKETLPAIGSYVLVTGTVAKDILTNVTFKETDLKF